MANSVYILGGTSDNGAYYFYALRRDDEGNLFIRRDDVSGDTVSPDIFGGDKPAEFDGAFIDYDYDEGRNGDHTLKFTNDQVKYEQWFWDSKLASFYINGNGELVAAYGKENKWLANSDYITFNDTITPNAFTLTLFGTHQEVDVYQALLFAGWNSVDPVEVTNHGVIKGVTTEMAALTIKGDYPYGITLINNGEISGAPGYRASVNISGDPGTGIDAAVLCTIINTSIGTINGGASATGGSDGYAIVGIDNVTLTDNGQIGSTI
jgi:hypothetical protein